MPHTMTDFPPCPLAAVVLCFLVVCQSSPGQQNPTGSASPVRPKAQRAGEVITSTQTEKDKRLHGPRVRERVERVPAVSPEGLDLPNGGKVIVPEGLDGLTGPTDGSPPAVRPERPERPALSPEVKEQIRKFDQARDTFLQQRRELERQLTGASDEERRNIRSQLKESLDQWKEQRKQFRVEAQERRQELKQELLQHREALEDARGAALEAKEKKTRPGLD